MRMPEFTAEHSFFPMRHSFSGAMPVACPLLGPVEPALPRSLECLPVGIAAGLICGPICGVLANLLCNEGKAY